jgi:hypothetical protein
MRHPEGDAIIGRLIDEANQALRSTHPLGGSQIRRLNCALHFTLDSMAVCEHPLHEREAELVKVQAEMVAMFRTGEYLPEGKTEKFWHDAERECIRLRTQPQITRSN